MSRDPQLRSDRVLGVGAASLASLVGLVAVGLKDSKITMWFTRVDGPVDSGLWLVQRTSNACLNVESVGSPANGGRIYMPAARPVGFKLVRERELAW